MTNLRTKSEYFPLSATMMQNLIPTGSRLGETLPFLRHPPCLTHPAHEVRPLCMPGKDPSSQKSTQLVDAKPSWSGVCLGLLLSLACLAIWPSIGLPQTSTIRVGHFPNITHLQGLVAHHLTRQGRGWFEQRLGPGVKIEWFVYNAGPSAMEAILANSIDLTYVGPNPAINAYAKSRGREIRIVAGAANGGAALVVQPDSQLRTPTDFRGKRLATPQLGNTQDVSARAWLVAGGLKITQSTPAGCVR